MRGMIGYIGWAVAGVVLGFVLAQYTSDGMLMAFLQTLPGCF